MRHGGRVKRSLPFTADPSNGTLGQAGLYSHIAEITRHAEAPIQI